MFHKICRYTGSQGVSVLKDMVCNKIVIMWMDGNQCLKYNLYVSKKHITTL